MWEREKRWEGRRGGMRWEGKGEEGNEGEERRGKGRE